jgi:hypothetical protein
LNFNKISEKQDAWQELARKINRRRRVQKDNAKFIISSQTGENEDEDNQQNRIM